MTSVQAAARTAPTPGEHETVLAAARGDRAAWGSLYERYAPVIHGLLLLSVARPEAEELTQEVFLRAMGKLRELREPGAVGAWLCAIARHEAASWGRRRGRMDVHLSRLAEEKRDASPSPPGSLAAPPLEGEAVLARIRELPEAYRETLVLRLVEGLTGPQIAAATGMTHGSVRVNLTRGMAMLKEALGLEKAGAPGGMA